MALTVPHCTLYPGSPLAPILGHKAIRSCDVGWHPQRGDVSDCEVLHLTNISISRCWTNTIGPLYKHMTLNPSILSSLCVCILKAFKRRLRALLAVYFLCVCYSMTAYFLLFESADTPLGGGMSWLVHLGSLPVRSGTTFHKFYKPTKSV